MRVWLLVLLFFYTGVLSAEHSIDRAIYDPNGNMKTDQYRSTVLNYDRANQPISITKYNLSPSSSTTYHFGYGVADNRIFKGTMSQAYYYLGSQGIYDINADKWEHYPGGVLRLKNGDIQKIVKDHLSNTRAIVGDNGSCIGLITAYDYYPFGKVLRKHENPASRFQSTDHEKDSETGYDDRHARLYDDEAFRFMQTDPKTDLTGEVYEYCANNPINLIDPTGEETKSTEQVNEEGWQNFDTKNDVIAKEAVTILGKRTNYAKHGKPSDNELVSSHENGSMYRTSNGTYLFHMAGNGTIGYENSQPTYYVYKDNSWQMYQSQQNIDKVNWETRVRFYENWGMVMAVALDAEIGFYQGGKVGINYLSRKFPALLANKSPRALGNAMEKALGMTSSKTAINIGGRTRFPDRLTSTLLEESKNVKHLSNTSQLRDYLKYSQDNGLDFILHTRPNTTFSKPLQQLIDNGSIIHNKVLGF